eukprot:SAG31_NODE_1573_length_7850_cov_1.757193_7_plen_51_part_00
MVCIIVEATGRLGYGAKMPSHVRLVLSEFVREEYGASVCYISYHLRPDFA